MVSLRKQIAQMLLMGFPGSEFLKGSRAYEWIAEEQIGGVILFDHRLHAPDVPQNLIDCAQIKRLTSALKKAATIHDASALLLIAIDYEGGAVDRLRRIQGCPLTLTARDLAQLSISEQRAQCQLMAETLSELGFNLNFAPVVDLNRCAEKGIIGAKGRAFSKDPLQVIKSAKIFMEAFNRAGILTCLKHFPGHGSASLDSHLGLVDVTHTFDKQELKPYEVLLKDRSQQTMVMTAHVVNKTFDSSGLPATLSEQMISVLRSRYLFDGVIISDDLQMQAISSLFSLEEALIKSIQAGVDLLMFGNQWAQHDASELITVIEKLVREQRISFDRIEQSYQRICHLKSIMFSEKHDVC